MGNDVVPDGLGQLDAELETAETAEIFEDLKMERDRHPAKPLFEGAWE